MGVPGGQLTQGAPAQERGLSEKVMRHKGPRIRHRCPGLIVKVMVRQIWPLSKKIKTTGGTRAADPWNWMH